MSRHPFPNRNPHQRSWSDRGGDYNRRRDFFGGTFQRPTNNMNRQLGLDQVRSIIFNPMFQRNFNQQQQHLRNSFNTRHPGPRNNSRQSSNNKRRHSGGFRANEERYNNQSIQHNNLQNQKNVVSNRILHHAEKKQKLEERYEERDDCRDYFITSDEIQLFKLEVRNCITKVYLEELCAKKARYIYFIDWKGHSKATELSERKPPQPEKHKCVPCDYYSNAENVHQAHLNSKLHHEINSIYKQLKQLADDWVQETNNLKHIVKPLTLKAEQEGLVISSEDSLRDEFFETDEWLDKFNITNIETEEKFVLDALEIRMKSIWPQPKTIHFCRICNYAEYSSETLLERHMTSARHLDFQRHYKEAFCVTCQVHNGDVEGMKKHENSKRHKQISEILEETKARAISYWSRNKPRESFHQNKDRHLVSNYRRDIQQGSCKQNNSSGQTIESNRESNVETFEPKYFSKPTHSNVGIVNPIVTQQTAVASVSPITPTLPSTPTTVVVKKEIKDEEYEIDTHHVKSPSPQPNTIKTEIKTGIKTEMEPIEMENQQKPIKSKFTEFLENLNQQEEAVEEVEKDIEEVEKPPRKKFDDFIVPLTGYMCTICHQTLDNDEEASTHMYSYEHRKTKERHSLKYN